MLAAMSLPDGEALEHEAEALLERALRLPDAQRARLAAELFESLEGPAETTTDDEWLAGVEARAERVRRGESQGIPWGEVRQRVLARLGHR
jgi:putative addiction module component (TIGR02574 family)